MLTSLKFECGVGLDNAPGLQAARQHGGILNSTDRVKSQEWHSLNRLHRGRDQQHIHTLRSQELWTHFQGTVP